MSTTKQVMASVAANTAGYATGVSGAAFVLTAYTPSDSLAHQVTVLNNTANTHAGKTITLVGTDENDRVITESMAGPAGSVSVTSVKFYKTLVSATPSATIGADTFNIGWALASQGPWVFPGLVGAYPFNIGIGCTVSSGSPTYAVKYSYDRVTWFTHATITAKTVSFDGGITIPCAAMRVDFAAAGGVTATFIQMADR